MIYMYMYIHVYSIRMYIHVVTLLNDVISHQVFHVPLEERRYQFEELSFGGETRQSEIVREIQEKTGCDIEMTQVYQCYTPLPPETQ